MQITLNQKRIIEGVLNAFETGSMAGDYAKVSLYFDGPKIDGSRIKQVTYGRSQTTEYSNLRQLIIDYVTAPGAVYGTELRTYIPRLGSTGFPLADNVQFIRLLQHAGNDPVMIDVQDAFFDKVYYTPAQQWCVDNGFATALAMLVVYDSFIHSGSIMPFLRKGFPERPPAGGGDEQVWISKYVDTRHHWLRTNARAELRACVYRTSCLKREITRGNWDLTTLPIDANGVPIS